jgi:hypothetical protein
MDVHLSNVVYLHAISGKASLIYCMKVVVKCQDGYFVSKAHQLLGQRPIPAQSRRAFEALCQEKGDPQTTHYGKSRTLTIRDDLSPISDPLL